MFTTLTAPGRESIDKFVQNGGEACPSDGIPALADLQSKPTCFSLGCQFLKWEQLLRVYTPHAQKLYFIDGTCLLFTGLV